MKLIIYAILVLSSLTQIASADSIGAVDVPATKSEVEDQRPAHDSGLEGANVLKARSILASNACKSSKAWSVTRYSLNKDQADLIVQCLTVPLKPDGSPRTYTSCVGDRGFQCSGNFRRMYASSFSDELESRQTRVLSGQGVVQLTSTLEDVLVIPGSKIDVKMSQSLGESVRVFYVKGNGKCEPTITGDAGCFDIAKDASDDPDGPKWWQVGSAGGSASPDLTKTLEELIIINALASHRR